MKYSHMLKWLLLLLLPISLGWKSALHIDYSTGFDDRIRQFLARNYFIVSESEEVMQNKRTFRASRGACRMLVTAISARGWERDFLKNRETEVQQVFFIFAGKVYAEPPAWPATFDYLRYKILLELGLKVRPSPVLSVIAAKSCDVERLPWYEIGLAEAARSAKHVLGFDNALGVFPLRGVQLAMPRCGPSDPHVNKWRLAPTPMDA